MSLGFLVPAFLLGLVAIGVPILIHLRQREQRDPIRFPSLMFLSRITQRTAERRRITNRWLLLLRALAVAGLVLAFARPFLEREPDLLLASRRRALVIALDRSMSMGYAGVWERALDSIRAAVGSLGAGERAGIVSFDESAEVVVPLTEDRAAFDAALARLEPGSGGTRLASGLRMARDLVAAARDEAVEVLLVSDLQRQSLQGLEAVDPLPGATLRVVPVGALEPANARVVSATVDRTVSGRQATLQAGARVATEGGSGPRRVRATLVVNDRELATTDAVLPPNGITSIAFPPVRVPDAAASAVVRLESDDLAADDQYRFTLGGPAGVPVLLVLPPGVSGDQLLYLERALGISRSPSFVVQVRRGAPSAADLARASVVVAADLAPLAGRGAALEAFVERGGGLLAFAGQRTGGNAVREPWLPGAVGRVVDRTTDRGGRLGWVQADHPIFDPFRDAVTSDFGSARFFRYREVEVDSTATTLARFDDGKPALVERRIGSGRALLWASASDAVWSDLPLQPVFLPLVHRLVGYASRAGDDKASWELGEVASLPASGEQLAVTTPAGAIQRLDPDTVARSVALSEVGYYQVRAGGVAEPILTLAVNPRAVESDLTAAAPGEVTALIRTGSDSSAAAPTPLTAVEQEARQRWWGWLLALVLALLAAETWYAGRLSPRSVPKGGTP